MTRRLTRAQDGTPRGPGAHRSPSLGNFSPRTPGLVHRRHGDAEQWGIAAFAGRSAGVTAELAEQENLYTLIVQKPEGNEYQVVSAISATHAGTDVEQLLAYFASSWPS